MTFERPKPKNAIEVSLEEYLWIKAMLDQGIEVCMYTIKEDDPHKEEIEEFLKNNA